MISFLRGILCFKKPPFLGIEVNGIGYECQAPMTTFYQLPDVGQPVFLHTHYSVREDAHVLYGFSQEQERALFRSLIKVNNVGPKLALAILSSIEVKQFVRYIQEQNLSALTNIPGVGKKTAERLGLEMKDKLEDWAILPLKSTASGQPHAEDAFTHDALSALVALGYKLPEASRLISKVAAPYQSTEELIRLALQSTLKGDKHDCHGSLD